MFFRKKPGYKKDEYYSPLQKKNGKRSEAKWIKSILIPGSKISLSERIVKFLIYIALRMVIRPRKWINPEKNFSIIDYTYKKISSEDLAFIPSSIAFYLVMGFMPILTLVLFVFNIPEIHEIFGESVDNVLSSFIPGLGDVISDIEPGTATGTGLTTGLITLLITSIWIASTGFAKMIYTQSYLFDFNQKGGYWGNKIKGIFMVIFLTIFLAGALAANLTIDKYFFKALTPGPWVMVLRMTFLMLSLFFGTILLFAIFFKFTPLYKVKFMNVLPGAFVTGVPTFLFLALFGYITNLFSYGNYGIIGIIMYIGMAALVITNFIFYGITANAAYNREFVEEALVSKRYKAPKNRKLKRSDKQW